MAYLKEEIKAGMIVVVSLMLLSAFSILIGGSKFFEKYDTYYVKVMNASGLESGAPVKLGGVRVGRVMDIKAPAKAGERVSITLGLKQGTTLYKGTKAFITQAGFVGDIYLLLSVDGTVDEKINVGETIPSVDNVDFNLMMAKVDVIAESVDRLLNDIDKLFTQNTIHNIEKAVENAGILMTEVSALAKSAKGEISGLSNRAGEAIEKVSETLLAIKNTTNLIGDSAAVIGKSADAIGDTAVTVEKTSDTIEGVVSLQSQNLSDLLVTMTEATETLQEVLQEIKNKPWSMIYKEGKSGNE